MPDAQEAINAAIGEVTKARSAVRRGKSRQVTSAEETAHLQAVVYSWTRTHRPVVAIPQSTTDLTAVDSEYDAILAATGRHAARSTYLQRLKRAKTALVCLRSQLLLAVPTAVVATGNDTPPSFASLATDQQMQDILTRRWHECLRCRKAEAHLAATVMMGGLLEALFVARANKLADKSPLFKAKSTPVDPKTKKPLALSEWTLRPYIDVGHELGWISKSGRDVAAVLRDYRNYVHPEKERSHGVTLGESDSAMFWEITKLLARQLLKVP